MKSHRPIHKQGGGPGVRPLHRRQARTDEVRTCRKRERQLLQKELMKNIDEKKED